MIGFAHYREGDKILNVGLRGYTADANASMPIDAVGVRVAAGRRREPRAPDHARGPVGYGDAGPGDSSPSS